jgi:hypothetical protein
MIINFLNALLVLRHHFLSNFSKYFPNKNLEKVKQTYTFGSSITFKQEVSHDKHGIQS